MRNTSDLEQRAIEAMRKAAREHLPVDAGLVQVIADQIKEAYRRGQEDTAAELADAYSLYRDDDLDLFCDAIIERLPSGWTIPDQSLDLPPAE